VPEVVCYKGNWISYQIAKRIITLKYISLVNLIMDEEVVTELIQDECNNKRIKQELNKLIQLEYRSRILEKYTLLEQKLGGNGASKKVAHLIYKSIKKLKSNVFETNCLFISTNISLGFLQTELNDSNI
jgi:lipid-A-disaccharide synthase